MWMTSKWLERNKILIRCGTHSINKLIWENLHHALIMFTWDVLKDHVKQAKIFWTITEPCSNPEFHQEQRKNYQARKHWVFLRGTTTWKVIPRSVMSRWPWIQLRRIEICGRIVKCVLSNCCETSVFGTYWKTWYSIISEQTCTIDHKMDQSMWQTSSTFDLLHSFHEWVRTVLSCGKHGTTMQIGSVSRLWLCWWSSRIEIDFRWNMKSFWKPQVWFGSWNSFSGCRFTHGRHSRAWSLGCDYWRVAEAIEFSE